jgi:FAD synthase
MSSVTQTGVYYGYAQVSPEKDGERTLSEEESAVHPMVMSLGWNPFYKNKQLTAVRRFFSLGLFNLILEGKYRKFISCIHLRMTSTVMK